MKAFLRLGIVLASTPIFTSAAENPKPTHKPAAPTGEFGKPAAEIDAAKPPEIKAKAFSVRAVEVTGTGFTSREKGSSVTNKLAANATVKQGAKAASFSDIKAGDTIMGTRRETGEAEYEVVAITKWIPKPAPKGK